MTTVSIVVDNQWNLAEQHGSSYHNKRNARRNENDMATHASRIFLCEEFPLSHVTIHGSVTHCRMNTSTDSPIVHFSERKCPTGYRLLLFVLRTAHLVKKKTFCFTSRFISKK